MMMALEPEVASKMRKSSRYPYSQLLTRLELGTIFSCRLDARFSAMRQGIKIQLVDSENSSRLAASGNVARLDQDKIVWKF